MLHSPLDEAGGGEEGAVGGGFLVEGEGVSARCGWQSGDVEDTAIGVYDVAIGMGIGGRGCGSGPGGGDELADAGTGRGGEGGDDAGCFFACGGNPLTAGHALEERVEVHGADNLQIFVGRIVAQAADGGACVVERNTLFVKKLLDLRQEEAAMVGREEVEGIGEEY